MSSVVNFENWCNPYLNKATACLLIHQLQFLLPLSFRIIFLIKSIPDYRELGNVREKFERVKCSSQD